MKILLDHNLPRRLCRLLTEHEVRTARQMGWDALENGVLLQTLATKSFEVFLTIDKNIRHQHNLEKLPVAVVVMDSPSNALPALLPFVPHLVKLLEAPLQRILHVIQRDGQIVTYGRSDSA